MDASEDAANFPLPTFARAFRVDLELTRDLYRDDWIEDSRQQTTCSSVNNTHLQTITVGLVNSHQLTILSVSVTHKPPTEVKLGTTDYMWQVRPHAEIHLSTCFILNFTLIFAARNMVFSDKHTSSY